MTFDEDHCRVRQGHADANLRMLRRTALSLLKNEPAAKVGIKNKRLTAAWGDEYLTIRNQDDIKEHVQVRPECLSKF